jgi:cobalt-zinc-cadmium resistance protein CzcA
VQQQKEVAQAQTALERTRLLPDLTFGYSNASIRGLGADDKFYSAGRRFHSVQVGVAVPVFSGSQKAKINSSQRNETVATARSEAAYRSFVMTYRDAFLQYSKQAQSLRYFETKALPNAELIIKTADRQFAAGAINYLEWAQLVNQAFAVQGDYTEALRQYNESIIQLQYYHQQ